MMASAAINREPSPTGQLDRPTPGLRIIEAVEPPGDDLSLYRRWVFEGDKLAGGLLFERYEAKLLRALKAELRNADAAMDISQATWLAAYESGTYAGRCPFYRWLRRVAATRMAKQRARERLRETADASWLEPGSETSPSRAVLRAEAAAALEDISHEKIRETTRRVCIEGQRPGDVAKSDGVAPSVVSMRVKRGMDRMREMFGR